MSQYDVYTSQSSPRRRARAYSFTADDDLAAEEFVTARLTDQPVELWCYSRLVARFSGRKAS